MVEASIVMPIMILLILLLLRLFAFYLEILDTSVLQHCKAAEQWSSWNGSIPRSYCERKDVSMGVQGLFHGLVTENVETKCSLYHEESMVRANEVYMALRDGS